MKRAMKLQKNATDIVRIFPGVDIHKDNGLMSKLDPPNWLHIIKSKDQLWACFTKHEPEDIGSIPISQGLNTFSILQEDIVYSSISVGEHVPHRISDVLEIIGKIRPDLHYSNQIVHNFLSQCKEDRPELVDNFGVDCVEMVYRLSCHHLTERLFPSPIDMRNLEDDETFGVDFLEMVADVAFLAIRRGKRELSGPAVNFIENFGEDLISLCFDVSLEVFRELRLRFSESRYVENFTSDEKYHFSRYRSW